MSCERLKVNQMSREALEAARELHFNKISDNFVNPEFYPPSEDDLHHYRHYIQCVGELSLRAELDVQAQNLLKKTLGGLEDIDI